MSDPERALDALRSNAERWARLPVAHKCRLLAELLASVADQAPAWAAAGAAAKGVAATPAEGEEWICGPWAVLYAIQRYLRTLRAIAASGAPRLPAGRIRSLPDGRTVVDVFPNTLYDRALLAGISAEVWMEQGVTPDEVTATMGAFYRDAQAPGRVALVLGAGNVSSIGPLDALHELVARGAVCMLKLSPVNRYLAPIFERALFPLIREGYLRICTGDAAVGARLAAHGAVDHIHVTGSAATYDAIASAARKPTTGELGNVTPTIVVPGPWSNADIRFQAEHIVSQKLHNGGFNCVAAQVLVVPEQWEGTARLLAEIGRLSDALPPRPQFYPGAAQRRAALLAERQATGRAIALVPAQRGDVGFANEAFCDVLFATAIPGATQHYLESAVAFANADLTGSLGANLIVHPHTARRHPDALLRAVSDLRYGCVGINIWAGAGYLLTETPWGAYRGNAAGSAGSGNGVVHDAYLFSRSLKSVVRGPFRAFPRPAWFVTNRAAARLGPALCAYERAPSLWTAARVAGTALRG